MKLKLSSEITKKIPGITVFAVVIKNIKNQRKSTNITQLLRGVCAQRKLQMKNEEKKKEILGVLSHGHIEDKIIPEVQLLESKIRKVGGGKDIAYKNNLESLLNYLAVKNLVPLFGMDLDLAEKDIVVDLVKPKQGKHPDDLDFTAETKHLVFWIIDIGSMDKEKFALLPGEFSKTIQKYCTGLEDTTFIINADNTEVDLGYTSAKETLYKEEQQKLSEQKQAAKQSGVDGDIFNALPNFLQEQSAQIKTEPLLKDQIFELFKRAVHEYLNAQNLYSEELLNLLEVHLPNESSNGDYASSIALKLAKTIEKDPQEIAEGIIKLIPKNDLIEKAEPAGRGFVNIYLSSEFLKKHLENILSLKENYGRLIIGAGQKVAIDYSSPNIAKPLGVHHLLSTLIGQTMVNLLRYSGYKVFALNYPGDWGTQFGKLVYAYKTWGNEAEVLKDPLNELLKLYVKFHEEAEKDLSLEDKGREEFKKLEEGDEENMKIWTWMKDISIREMERIYNKLDVHFDEYLGEYMYLERAKSLIKEGIEKGIIVEGEKGAWVVKFEDDKYPPYIMQKADGTTIYATRDLASIKDRIERLKSDILLYVVDTAQSLHFKQLFETAKKFEFTNVKFEHIAFGRMSLPDGKMSTRKGEIILLDEVIKEAASRAQILIEAKSKELVPEERNRIAQEMAISAIKYNIISQNRETNITFDLDRMLSMDGNSAPYLQYTLARAQSILRKYAEEKAFKKSAKMPSLKNDFQTDLFSITEARLLEENVRLTTKESDPAHDAKPSEIPLTHQAEINLLHLFPHFPEAIEHAVREYKSNIIANYLYELARAFNAFYDQVSVMSAANEELKVSRVKLVEAAAVILRNGLTVLGISVFDRM